MTLIREDDILTRPLLPTYIKSEDWKRAHKRLSTNPNEARMSLPDGTTPLHMACCQNVPLGFIRELLQVCPEAATSQNSRGFNPLHLASCFCTLEVMQELLSVSETPLWMKNVWSRTPREHMKYHLSFTQSRGRLFEEFWEKYRLLVQAEYYYKYLKDEYSFHKDAFVKADPTEGLIQDSIGQPMSVKNIRKQKSDSGSYIAFFNSDECVLHAFVGTECNDPNIIDLAMERYRDDLYVADANGNYPLHLACASSPKHFCSLNKILEAYPEAASMTNYAGELPLHISAKFGREWYECMNSLIWAHPAALTVIDKSSYLYPISLACLANPRPPSTTTIYQLLRSCPELGRFGINVES